VAAAPAPVPAVAVHIDLSGGNVNGPRGRIAPPANVVVGGGGNTVQAEQRRGTQVAVVDIEGGVRTTKRQRDQPRSRVVVDLQQDDINEVWDQDPRRKNKKMKNEI
jgi:hypothetical protein